MQKVLSEVPQHDLRTLQFYFQLCAATIRHFVAMQSADLLAGGALEREREKLKVIVRLCEHFTNIVRVRKTHICHFCLVFLKLPICR